MIRGQDHPGCGEALPVDLQCLVTNEARLAFEDGGVGLGIAPLLTRFGQRVDALPNPPGDRSQSRRSTRAVMPKGAAVWIVSATSAAWMSILEGMHPRFRQVPPNLSFSMMAIVQPAWSGPGIVFPEPAPTIIRSNCCTIRHLPFIVWRSRLRAR